MSEADRIARRLVRARESERREAERHELAEHRRAEQELASDLRTLIREILALAELPACKYDGIKPVTVKTHRFPPLGDLLGDWTRTKGGWEIGACGHLLGDGRWEWQGRIENPFTHPYLASHHDSMCSGLRELKKTLTEKSSVDALLKDGRKQ